MTVNYNPDVLSCLANLSNDEVFTPPVLVNKMLDLLPTELWSNPKVTFLDPVCKTGVFLREIAKRLMVGLASVYPDRQTRINHILHQQLYGIAITELTGLLSRRSVYCSKTANGKYSICDDFDSEQGNIVYTSCRHTWVGGRCKYCGASQSVYDRDEALESHAYQFIHTKKTDEIFKMKFDVIIGNPPYQLEDGGNGASAKPIYHKFIEQAKKLNPRYLVMIVPSRWFAGGKGLDSFRESMLSDSHIKIIKDYINAKDCFPGISIGGGVCYFLWEKSYVGQCSFTTCLNGKEDTALRSLSEFPVFVRYNVAVQLIHKIKKITKDDLSDAVLSRNPFGISSYVRGELFEDENSYTLYSSSGVSYIKENLILQNLEYAKSYKVMLSKVTCEHAGEPDKNGQVKLLSSVKFLKPKEVCTDSYLVVGRFDTEDEAYNLKTYLKTKFARFLLLQAVSSINLSKEKFMFVPLQDFSKPWTDEELYAKYKLTPDEIAFIESMIRPME